MYLNMIFPTSLCLNFSGFQLVAKIVFYRLSLINLYGVYLVDVLKSSQIRLVTEKKMTQRSAAHGMSGWHFLGFLGLHRQTKFQVPISCLVAVVVVSRINLQNVNHWPGKLNSIFTINCGTI